MTFSMTAARHVAAAAALALAAPAFAQAASPPAQPQGTIAVGDDQLRSFARAWLELGRIDREMAPRLEAAGPERKERLEQEVQARMVAAVERHDLDAPTFNMIAAAAERDPELAGRIAGHAQEALSTP